MTKELKIGKKVTFECKYCHNINTYIYKGGRKRQFCDKECKALWDDNQRHKKRYTEVEPGIYGKDVEALTTKGSRPFTPEEYHAFRNPDKPHGFKEPLSIDEFYTNNDVHKECYDELSSHNDIVDDETFIEYDDVDDFINDYVRAEDSAMVYDEILGKWVREELYQDPMSYDGTASIDDEYYNDNLSDEALEELYKKEWKKDK